MVPRTWKNIKNWHKMAIMNVAGKGKFSSDRSIRDYCEQDMESETVWD
jgi:glucan phosphorylase